MVGKTEAARDFFHRTFGLTSQGCLTFSYHQALSCCLCAPSANLSRFYTQQHCKKLLPKRGLVRPDREKSLRAEWFAKPPESYRLFPIAMTPSRLDSRRSVGDRGPSSENWQLYYELLHTYEDSQGL